MPVTYRPWISPYGDRDFDWDPKKSLRTFEDRDFVFEAARIVFRGPLIRRQDTRRRRSTEPRFMVLGELYGRVVAIILRRGPGNAASSRCVSQTRRKLEFIMNTRADKPREYFSKLLDAPEEEIDYREIPPTTAADWQDAEVLFPVTGSEFRAIEHFIWTHRAEDMIPSKTYDLFVEAIKTRKQIVCRYNGYYRELCPVILGHKDGKEKALTYQFGGDSEKGLPPGGQWRCLFLSRVGDVQLREGPWHTGNSHTQPQGCVEIVELDVNPESPDNPKRRPMSSRGAGASQTD